MALQSLKGFSKLLNKCSNRVSYLTVRCASQYYDIDDNIFGLNEDQVQVNF